MKWMVFKERNCHLGCCDLYGLLGWTVTGWALNSFLRLAHSSLSSELTRPTVWRLAYTFFFNKQNGFFTDFYIIHIKTTFLRIFLSNASSFHLKKTRLQVMNQVFIARSQWLMPPSSNANSACFGLCSASRCRTKWLRSHVCAVRFTETLLNELHRGTKTRW